MPLQSINADIFASFILCNEINTLKIPMIGARTMSQLEDNLDSLNFSLSEDQKKRLDGISRIEMGFPHDFLNSDRIKMVVDGTAKVKGRPY
jgi:diketogulonate reductase-like aldo/keto reductase